MRRSVSLHPLHLLSFAAFLLTAGYWLGQAAPLPEAHAQAVIGGRDTVFASGARALVTSSADGRTLYLWTLGDKQTEQIKSSATPKLVAEVKAP